MELVAQKLFGKLWHDHGSKYIVTIDGCYNNEFYADNDSDAIKYIGWDPDTMVTK